MSVFLGEIASSTKTRALVYKSCINIAATFLEPRAIPFRH